MPVPAKPEQTAGRVRDPFFYNITASTGKRCV